MNKKNNKLYDINIYFKTRRKPLKIKVDDVLLIDKFYALLIGPNDIIKFYTVMINRLEINYIDIIETNF